ERRSLSRGGKSVPEKPASMASNGNALSDRATITGVSGGGGQGSDRTTADHHSADIPPYLLDDARRWRENKVQLESRRTELEQCNKLLESQLDQFRQYINSASSLDSAAKQRLENRIEEAEKLLDRQNQLTDAAADQADGGQSDSDA